MLSDDEKPKNTLSKERKFVSTFRSFCKVVWLQLVEMEMTVFETTSLNVCGIDSLGESTPEDGLARDVYDTVIT
jgi:hypothetical protein